MPRLETLSEVVLKRLEFFPCIEFETTPWAPLGKNLPQCKMALVSTAGLHLRDDKPFLSDLEGKDASYRVIPSSASSADILQSHESIGFDHTTFYGDMKDRPNDVSIPQFLHLCVADLKAFYYEARMAQRPTATESELHTWFGGETATGHLISDVARRMSTTGDAGLESLAFALAR